jgi:tRNA A-37 threonylcarbamoyl transferase component Bud32
MAEAMVPTQVDAEPAAARQTLAPAELAPFFPQLEILECLGRGGMGVVYKARQKTLNRIVALKLLAPERVRDAQFAERFTREAQALAALSHPNIVTIYDFGQAGGFYFLLMEFVDGLNLRQLLRMRKFTPEEALAIVPPLCDALQLAHDRGIVHRDIKPENLLLDKDGHVKVADFGIAKMLGAVDAAGKGGGASARENATQTAVGTPGYSAPEQKTDPQRVDSRADIYSLGVVFYEMLTGELPGKRIEPPSRKVQIDVRLDDVVLRALESDPERRYQQASVFKTQVETIASTPPGPQPAGGATPTVSRLQARWPGNLRARWLGGLVLLALLSLFAVYFWISMDRSQVIVEGKGWRGFNVGATRAELIKALGQPDSDSDNRWMKWKQAHVHCLVDDARGAFELRFDEGFPGFTTAGIGIGSPLKDALAAYGEPSSQENVGSAKKLLWISKGILIWFHEDRAAQIVVFQKTSARTGSDAANPLVEITGTPARSGQYQIAEGNGWNGFKLGATRVELIQALGQPDSDSDNRWMKWKQAHVHCLVDDANGAFELRFDEGFPGLTTAGIGIGSPLKDALAAYGEPSSQENVGSAKKLLWNSKGILIWFHEDRAAQIVVFQKPDQPSTLTPPAGLVELKWKWPPVGERVVLDVEIKRNGEYLTPGQSDPLKEYKTVEKKLGLTVLKTTPGGGQEVELEFLSIRDRITLGDKTMLDYDSTQKSSAPGPNSLTDIYGKVVGSKIRYFLNASNEVERMEGVDELEKRLSSGASADAAFSKIQFSEGNLKQMMSGLYRDLPSKAVQPGDTWSYQMGMAMNPIGTVNMNYTVTFQNWEQHWKRNCARLEIQSTVKTKPDTNSNPAGTSVSSFEGTISGVAWFDPELGMIIETAGNTDMKMVINRPINPGGNPGASGPTPGTVYQWHDAVNTTVLQHFVLETPDAAISGIGVALRVDGVNIVVQEIIPGSPAAVQKDIHVGDRIIAVAQDTGPAVPVQGGQLAQAVALIHGPAGTTVRLTLVSSGEDDSRARVVSFVRAELKTPPR